MMKSLLNIFRTISQEKMFPNTKFMMLSLRNGNNHARGLQNIAEICQEMNIDLDQSILRKIFSMCQSPIFRKKNMRKLQKN